MMAFQPGTSSPPDSIDIEQVHHLVRENYPLHQKPEIQDRITAIQTRIANTGYYPEITFSARTSYQSDVTSVNFVPPGTSAPQFSKDHYKIAMDLNQSIYDGGVTGIRKKMEKASGDLKKREVEVTLHQLREQVNQVYFSILLLQQQAESIRLLSNQLRDQLRTVRSGVKNGVLTPGQASILEAELIKTQQDSIRTAGEVGAAYEVLSELAGTEISRNSRLVLPKTDLPGYNRVTLERPEYALFESNRDLLNSQKNLFQAQRVPKLSAFATTAYGRPGLDAFNDDLQPYYIVGLRLQWNFKNWLNGGREMEAIRLQKQQVSTEQQTFTRQLQASLARTRSSVKTLEEVLKKDHKIVELREEVVQESSSRLANGTITATEYLTELTKANQARLTEFLHRVQLQKEKMEYKTKMGMSWK